MKLCGFAFALILLSVRTPLHAEINEEYEKILVPVTASMVFGAYGSIWKSYVDGWNDSSESVQITDHPGRGPCHLLCPSDQVSSYSSFRVLAREYDRRAGSGTFLFVARSGADKVSLHLRLQDLSRQSQTWGTEIPLIRSRDLFTGKVQLLNVPLGEQFRQALRIYDFDGPNDRRVLVRFFSLLSNGGGPPAPLVEQEVTLTADRIDPFSGEPLPGYAQFTDVVGSFPQILGADQVRIEIQPITPGLRFWAFMSVTNNETQHVTLITPQADPRAE